jgi:hypothetical protein
MVRKNAVIGIMWYGKAGHLFGARKQRKRDPERVADRDRRSSQGENVAPSTCHHELPAFN